MTDVMRLVYWFEKIFPYPSLSWKHNVSLVRFKKNNQKSVKSLIVFMKKNKQNQTHYIKIMYSENDLNLNNVTSTNQ